MNQRQIRHRHNVPAARDLRRRETAAEDVLWEALRRRQLDGGVHPEQQEQDVERAAVLAGYRLIRFPNEAVHERMSDVLATIAAAARESPLFHPPVPGRRSGM